MKKLSKKNLVAKFHGEMSKSLEHGHIKILTEAEIDGLKNETVYFPFLNYLIKMGSSTQKQRTY